MSPFDAIQYVGTPLSLIAFALALGAWAYRARLAERRKLIETAPDADRGRLLDAAIRDFTTVDTSTLTREQRYALAMRLIDERAARFRTMMMGGGFAAVVIAVIVIVASTPAADPYVSLTVRVQEPGGASVNAGSLTLDAGAGRTTQPIGSDGQAKFENVPRAAFQSGVRIYPEINGYAAEPAVLDAPPEGNVYYLELERLLTPVSGLVVDGAGNPLEHIVLLFDGGAAVDTTDALGRFRVLLPQKPGERVPLRMMSDGGTGFNDLVVIPVDESLTLRYDPRS